ncbi:hypothetical protein A3F07_03925 [candidate division WWE3 bacterium RIFCSPHIGHO2_12_FULL_38_15]|uniref:DUF3105 domain-containing protein n=1 Tax=candidate division WWE3 bacterium RIFCSPHIGHO2_02_FULL_38_14 TaxID=1802620 RepID=A0A1F4V802_UNCKA|nr:MAG: hypothetical protein A2793_00155 [candidate division WWE3 bacterium RIFCSPHIGHO2_01_FULL_38_45]OGC48960.1 MAG: hypothetical protein A3F07_03925 [candidate division WWE3 bacterium RIFCSPHIGHO2_12_FULL_38_15]OGC53266.1 MAG: hypothetical protein A3D91_02520 [candidate division WWE3 bacterium RIFCSPHIGHO2_02_FULL_38_14]OGC53715.1 MAG: hypothetical protein A3B64_04770 [candidate division WWE3 bacterium RIFCSPLOWO2_01_FULL_37_24]
MSQKYSHSVNEKWILLSIGFFTLLIFVGIIFLASKQESKNDLPLAGESIPEAGRNHIPRGQLMAVSDPPTSGDHYGDGVAGPGIHDDIVDDGLMVHSLEHGAVSLNYDPEKLSEDQVNQLKDIFNNSFKGKKMMMPRKNMSSPIIMVSWGQMLKLDSIDEVKMVEFMMNNNDRGPEKVSMF